MAQPCSIQQQMLTFSIHAAAMMATVYEDHKDEDGFLYITYSGENTFGGALESVAEAEASA